MAITKPTNLSRVWASAADPADVVDPDVNPGGNKFINGWVAEKPPFQNFNYLQQLFTQAIGHIDENTVMTYSANTNYQQNGLAKGSDGNWYQSKMDDNIGNDPVLDVSETNWSLYFDASDRSYKSRAFFSEEDPTLALELTNKRYVDGLLRRKNLFINGTLDFWQRGNSNPIAAFAGGYVADRWHSVNNTDVNRSTDVPTNQGVKFSAQITTQGGVRPNFRQGVELPKDGEAGIFQVGETFTYSAWIKAPAGNDILLSAFFRDEISTTTNQSIDFNSVVIGQGTGSWEFYTYTHTIVASPNATNLLFGYYLTYDLIDSTMYVAKLQLEKSLFATDFEYRPAAEELALCQRYYEKSYPEGVFAGNPQDRGSQYGNPVIGTPQGNIIGSCGFRVTKRRNPDITIYNNVTGAANNVRFALNNYAVTAIGAPSSLYLVNDTGAGWPSPSPNNVGMSYQFAANAEV